MLSVLSIPSPSGLYLARRMDIREIRRQNLVTLRQELGSVKEIADLVDTDANCISQLLSEKSRYYMGHNMARRLERACKKPSGWMDQSHADEALEADILQITLQVRHLSRVQRDNLKSFLESMIVAKGDHRDTPLKNGSNGSPAW